jgi:hypothetical protein
LRLLKPFISRPFFLIFQSKVWFGAIVRYAFQNRCDDPGDHEVITAFEIQVLNKGDWKIDSIFDDGDLAEVEASRVFGRGAYDAVRVVQENYNEATDTTSIRTVTEMKKASAEEAVNGAAGESRDVISANDVADAQRRYRSSMKPEAATPATEFRLLWWVGLIVRSIAIALAGLGVLFLLRLLYEL